MSFDWNLAKTFLAVAESGSLSAGARALGQTQPTVSRQIAALEKALNVTLFERTGRSITLTQFGIDLLDHIRAMSASADRVALAATGQAQAIEGQVRITASEFMSTYVLPKFVRKICAEHPGLDIDIVADNGVRDLARREADIAIRHVRPEQPNLLMRRVQDEVLHFYASQPYIVAYGYPTLKTMSFHQIISYVDPETMLGYLVPAGMDLTRKNFRFTTSSHTVALEMAREGLGMIVTHDKTAARFPDLSQIKMGMEPFQIPTWLVTHSELKTSGRIRFVFDRLGEVFA